MQLNEAVSKRLGQLLQQREMTQYQLYLRSGVPKSTIGNVILIPNKKLLQKSERKATLSADAKDFC